MSKVTHHRFRVKESQIGIYTESPLLTDFETVDGESVVIVSIRLAETHVTVISEQARLRPHWTAIFGWSSLTSLLAGPESVHATLDELPRALRGQLRRYGAPVCTDGFLSLAQDHLRGAIGHILDRTIGSGSEYDRIVIAAPPWLHEAAAGCLDLRPHVWNEIQDL